MYKARATPLVGHRQRHRDNSKMAAIEQLAERSGSERALCYDSIYERIFLVGPLLKPLISQLDISGIKIRSTKIKRQ